MEVEMHDDGNTGVLTEDQLRAMGFKSCGSNVRIARNCMIFAPTHMSIGNDVRIDGFCTLSGSIDLGSNIHIAGYCGLYGKHGIVMEDFSGLSAGCRLYSASDDYSGEYMTNPTVPDEYLGIQSGAVALGRHVIVGSGTLILPGVTISEGSAVGSLSLVNRSLDPWGIYTGVPARRIKDRSRKLLELEQKYISTRGGSAQR